MAKHPDFKIEQEKINSTIEYINSEIDRITEVEIVQDAEVQELMKQSGGRYTVELDIADRVHNMSIRMLSNMSHALDNPYFTRVDFLRKDDRLDELYIGKWGVIDPTTQRPIIIDWRSSIANLYYTHQVGPADYPTPRGQVFGKILVKRLLDIEKGKLRAIVEANIISEGTYLNDVLSDHADTRLKDIVTTIQAEQNQVLRCNPKAPLIVQGVAGAGKTTIALHRIMWLLYAYKDNMLPENLMIIAPNPIFLDYISAVLPNMGVGNVIQETFHGLAKRLCGSKLYKLNDSYTLLKLIDPDVSDIEKDILKECASIKGSLEFKKCVLEYIRELPNIILPKEDIYIDIAKVISYKTIYDIYVNELSPFPHKQRKKELEKSLKTLLNDRATIYRNKIEQEVFKRANFIRERAKSNTPERMKYMKDLYEVRDKKIEIIEKSAKTAVKDYIKKIKLPKLIETYRMLLCENSIISTSEIDEKQWKHLVDITIERLDNRAMDTSDVPPLLMLQKALFGHAERMDIHHTVLDEAQDFSPFMFDILKSFTHNTSFTIVGDLSQGIYVYRGIKNWAKMRDDVFDNNSTYSELVTSYRNTVEIMQLAEYCAMRHALDRTPAKPVLRHGIIPKLTYSENVIEDIAKEVIELKVQGMKTIAIIDKMPRDCMNLYKKLSKKIDDIILMKDDDLKYSGGVMIMPAHLCKGLEFDALIIKDISEKVFVDDLLHARLLYVCLTRPLHHLSLYYHDDISQLINQDLCQKYNGNGTVE